MTLAVVSQANLADVADAWRLGVPDRVNQQGAPEATRATLVRQADEQPITTFPARVFAPGFKLVRDRIMRLGGNMGRPAGPPLDHPRTRVPARTPAAGSGVNSRAVARMPAGLTPTQPWWESHLFGSDGYMAP